MLITLSVRLESGMYAHHDWGCELDIDDQASLHDLHLAIQQAVHFDNDHLYAFFISRKTQGAERQLFDGEEFSHGASIASLFPLPAGKKLFYWFDFGDDWIFQVGKSRKRPKDAGPDAPYPRVSGESGTRPVQYEGYDPHAEPEW
ncbi:MULTISPECIES: IS1096 element passenger TnpR family protein [Oceanimonas]|uniref:Plasmid pRiA4b Orf3-like domain-containing protein n=1 Tax=Oceanimonas doudoroffii TaxID=84158 RepID=A0A233RF66_9GAMM|nr:MULTISPECIES: hypothetical protein [Oceanimonas]NHI01521.1 hypothetical protein [Oceanimonas sp. MB9]OXY82016.1 hypothetical protein B6S08_00305 [Oceanimonas doudoroffii]